MENKTLQRLEGLRTLMKSLRLDTYIIPSNDPHGSEYLSEHWQCLQWFSGFKGESGTIVVTLTEAYLWTDSRFYLQAQKQLEGSSIGLMKASELDTPSINQWIISQGLTNVGVNAQLYSYTSFQVLEKELGSHNITIHNADLIEPLWSDRPISPNSQLYVYSEDYAGESTSSKIGRVREIMRACGTDTMVISALDEIAWLLNIRGTDVECNPLFISYVVLTEKECFLFADAEKVSTFEAQQYLRKIEVVLKPYESIYDYLHTITGSVLFDGSTLNEALYEALGEGVTKRLNTPSPIQIMKCTKNAVELSGERKAMVYDAVALTRFFKWLEEELRAGKEHTECTISDKLHSLRATQPNFITESFPTIAGVGSNGAIVHYFPTPADCATIHPNNVLLLDSGGQYLDGTTDITRTVWLGDDASLIPEEVKHDFTLVLKGHIALARAKFPKGTRGNQLDVLAKQFLWNEGMLYSHGTGHGVGHFLGCHEGPQGLKTDNNPAPLRLGNVCSDEPGLYRTGEYGIRIENLVVVVPATDLSERTTGEEYYQFEAITKCFYDTRLIDKSMLTSGERKWLNSYHAQLYKQISPLLSVEESEYLKKKCEAI